jgi:hypothetical protein
MGRSRNDYKFNRDQLLRSARKSVNDIQGKIKNRIEIIAL